MEKEIRSQESGVRRQKIEDPGSAGVSPNAAYFLRPVGTK
jgi:hypothetical protein